MLTVLGGGPAGLSVAYAARLHGAPVQLYEARHRVGGNCVTFRAECRGEEFRYDSGAHRFHDKDPGVTRELFRLMGDELHEVEAPSRIHSRGRLLDFPLDPIRLPFQMGPRGAVRATVDYLRRPRIDGEADCFEELALGRYGRALAERFLLSYSEKLWGAPCSELSPDISGKRLQGLDLWTTILEAFGLAGSDPRHMEASFFYPADGYGRICERLAESIGKEHIHTGRPVTGLRHDGRRITHVELADGSVEEARLVCNTLPLNVTLRCLRPPPPRQVLEAAEAIRFRHLLLVAIFLDRPKVSESATVYFPDPEIPFTRVVEPRNRSSRMAPPSRTSVVAEIPCFRSDGLWAIDDEDLARTVADRLSGLGWLRRSEVLGHEVRRVPCTYPVLTVHAETCVRRSLEYLGRFENLLTGGRNGAFAYRHLHDMMRFGLDAVDRMARDGSLREPVTDR